MINKSPVIPLLFISLLMLTGYVVAERNQTNVSSIIFSHPEASPVPSLTASHDYVLQKVTLGGDYAYSRPGRSIAPRIFVHNQGGDDINPGNVPVEAWVGDTVLIPVTGSFAPLQAGKSAMYNLRYMIPQDIPLLPNHLTIKVDPWNTRGESGTGTNEITTLSLVVLEDKDWKKI